MARCRFCCSAWGEGRGRRGPCPSCAPSMGLTHGAPHPCLAERYISTVEIQQNYPLLLLMLATRPHVPVEVRTGAALLFKNLVKRSWVVVRTRCDDGAAPLTPPRAA